MSNYKITWQDEDGNPQCDVVKFEDWTGRAENAEGEEFGPTMTITAYEWAVDHATAVSNGQDFEISVM